MRVAVVAPFWEPAHVYGGPTRSVPDLARGMAAAGAEVEVFTTTAAGGGETLDVPTGRRVVVGGLPVRHHPAFAPRDTLFLSPALARALRRDVGRFDVAYVYGLWIHPALAAGRACRRAGVPYVVTPRTGLMDWGMRQRARVKRLWLATVARRYLAGAAALHYTTDQERRESRPRAPDGVADFVVPNPVDASDLEGLAGERWGEDGGGDGRARADAEGDHRPPTVLHLGRLEPRKGLDLAIRALPRVREEVPGARLVAAGPDKRGHRAGLVALAEELGVREAVAFPGFVEGEERLAAFRDADLFLLASHTENFAVAAVEAMAAGLPAVLSEAVGVAPAAAEAGAARLVAREPAAIADALAELLADPGRRRAMSKRAADHARRYAPDRVAGEMLERLEALAG